MVPFFLIKKKEKKKVENRLYLEIEDFQNIKQEEKKTKIEIDVLK